MSNRFVILHHETTHGEHWDLMLEQGGVLLTWQLTREPIDRSDLPIPAGRIADHRTAYLEYEGPVSRHGGRVRRVDAGAVVFEPPAPRESEADRPTPEPRAGPLYAERQGSARADSRTTRHSDKFYVVSLTGQRLDGRFRLPADGVGFLEAAGE